MISLLNHPLLELFLAVKLKKPLPVVPHCTRKQFVTRHLRQASHYAKHFWLFLPPDRWLLVDVGLGSFI